jgi:hypothetical protein
LFTARNLLLAERAWKSGLGGIHGGERGVILLSTILESGKGRGESDGVSMRDFNLKK